MTIVRKSILCFSLLLLIQHSFLPTTFRAENSAGEMSKSDLEELNKKIKDLEHRLSKLEPAEPRRIEDPPWGEPPFPTKVLPITEVLQRGNKIHYKFIVDKPDYERPTYEEHWQSKYARWSYLPERVHYALHRLFTNYDIGLSGWYDFEHQLGISVPMFQDPVSLDLYIVAFQTEIKEVYTLGNQIVVVGHPKRNGVQAITLKTADIEPTDKNEQLLVQLATINGYEMDYSLISYVKPDFWNKQSLLN